MNIFLYYEIIVLLLIISLSALILLEQYFFSVKGDFGPRASIIIPVRGLDPGWQKNADSFRKLDYPNEFDVTYVVDPDDTGTADALRSEGLRVLISSGSCKSCGSKVAAQLTGLRETSGEAVIFADSDIRVREDWLRNLVAPLGKFDAVTTFSWPLMLKRTFLNTIRAGFWILGYDGHISAGGLLWGGSMAFKRQTLDNDYVAFMQDKVYDDVTTTNYLKANGKKISFNGDAVCFNAFDDDSFSKWASRQEMLIRKYSPRVALGFFSFMLALLVITVYGIIVLNPFFLSIYVLWWLKGVLTSIRIGRISFSIPFVSIASSVVAFFILIFTLRKKETVWRDHTYKF